jgi:hypothetical protein
MPAPQARMKRLQKSIVHRGEMLLQPAHGIERAALTPG